MYSYLLTSHDVSTLCSLLMESNYYRSRYYFKSSYEGHNQSDVGWSEPDRFINAQKTTWESFLFNDLLTAQPELKPIVDEFWERCRKTQYINILAGELFANKIKLDSVKDLIFEIHSNDCSSESRKEFITNIINKEPSMMDKLHNHIKSYMDVYIDIQLVEVYVNLLPTHLNQIKDTQENILLNIGKSKKLSEGKQIKLLKSLIKIFPQDKLLYDFLKSHFAEKFDQCHNLRKTFQQMEEKYFSSFKENKTKENYFDSLKIFQYILSVKDSVLIDSFGVKTIAAPELNKKLCCAIETIVTENIGKSVFFTESNRGLEINTENFEDKNKIEVFMEKMKNCLYDLLISLDEELQEKPDRKQFEELMRKILLSYELRETMQVNTDSTKKRPKL